MRICMCVCTQKGIMLPEILSWFVIFKCIELGNFYMRNGNERDFQTFQIETSHKKRPHK